MNRVRGALLIVLVVMLGAVIHRQFQRAAEDTEARKTAALQARVAGQSAPVPPPWRWPDESTWVVHQVSRWLATWTIAREQVSPSVTVTRRAASKGPGTFDVVV